MTKVEESTPNWISSISCNLLLISLSVLAVWYSFINNGRGSSMNLLSKQENDVVLPPICFLYQQAVIYSPVIKNNTARRVLQVGSVASGVLAFASVIYGIYGAIYGQVRTLSCFVSVIAFTAATGIAFMKERKSVS